MWFSQSVSDILGAWLGASAGLSIGAFGAFIGIYAAKGKFKRLFNAFSTFLVIMGALSLAAGLYAQLIQQPRHVWFPFALVGIIVSCVSVPMWFMLRKIFREYELNKTTLKDIK